MEALRAGRRKNPPCALSDMPVLLLPILEILSRYPALSHELNRRTQPEKTLVRHMHYISTYDKAYLSMLAETTQENENTLRRSPAPTIAVTAKVPIVTRTRRSRAGTVTSGFGKLAQNVPGLVYAAQRRCCSSRATFVDLKCNECFPKHFLASFLSILLMKSLGLGHKTMQI